MSKDLAYRVLLLVFLGNFFFEENREFLYKRIIYSAFIYIALYQIFVFYRTVIINKGAIKMPAYFKTYKTFYILSILCCLCYDFFNPAFNLVTLVNNPQALLSVVSVFIFPIGVYTSDLKNIYSLLKTICLVFLFVWVVKLPGRVPYFESYVASHAIIPLFILASIYKEKKILAFVFALVLLAVPYSMVSDQRIVLLKILMFFSFVISLNLVKKNNFLKLVIALFGCAFIYLMLTNLEEILNAFKESIGSKKFDSNDTRTFLYEELFADFKNSEFLLGRGFLGSYFSPYFLERLIEQDDIGDHYQRFGVEVGFLQLILKGGVAQYILYTLPLWYIAIRSIFFNSHIKIVFYIGIYIFTELLLMFIGNGPYFGFQFCILFFLAGYAYRGIVLNNAASQNLYTNQRGLYKAKFS